MDSWAAVTSGMAVSNERRTVAIKAVSYGGFFKTKISNPTITQSVELKHESLLPPIIIGTQPRNVAVRRL